MFNQGVCYIARIHQQQDIGDETARHGPDEIRARTEFGIIGIDMLMRFGIIGIGIPIEALLCTALLGKEDILEYCTFFS